MPAVRAVQDAEGDEDDLEDEAFEKELEAMAKYGSDDEEPQSFAALHKRLTAQRREEAAAGARVARGWAGRGGRAGGQGSLQTPVRITALHLTAAASATWHCPFLHPCRRRQQRGGG